MLLTTICRLHSLGIIIVITFLLATIIGAAKTNFIPDHSRYKNPEFQNKNGGSRFALSIFRDPRNKKFLILDKGPNDSTVHSELNEEIISRLINGIKKRGGLVTRSQGEDINKIPGIYDTAILCYPGEQYTNIDFKELAKKINSKAILDYCAGWSSYKADLAGLMHMNFARTFWPHWLDPELHLYIKHLKEKVKEGESILLIPTEKLATTAARARWFLPLNYYLAPRKFYLWNPQEGTSYLTEYFQWVKDYSQLNSHQGQRRIKDIAREISTLQNMNPARSLNKEELEAVENHNINWILFWRHQADFRICDFELIDIKTVRGWSE
jgi:hypothetical protein